MSVTEVPGLPRIRSTASCQRQTLRALALDLEDAVAGADARGEGGTVGQRTEHEKLLRLGIDCRADANAHELLVEVVLEFPVSWRP